MNRLPVPLFAAGTFALILFAFAPSVMGQASVQGVWQTLPYTMPINPVHAALLRTGKVLIVSGSGNLPTDLNYQAALWDPQAGTVTTQPVAWDMFCNGMVVLPDGRPFIMGGTLQYDPFYGEVRTSAYDPSTGAFTDQQSMAHGRWYPTGTVLGDGRIFVFSGLDETGATNSSVEIYTVGSGWGPAFAAPWTPPLYPRMHLLPNGNLFYSGSTTGSSLFNTATNTWTTNIAYTNYSGTRTYGSSVLLPLTPANGYKPRVMIFGGGNPATATTELIDLSVGTPKWAYAPSMSQPRIEMNATLLPSGQTLTIGGSLNDEDTNTASLKADLFDANGATVSAAGSEVYARLYHSVSLLMPDATVWVAGGNPARGTYEPHMEIYSPPYLFNSSGTLATRPTITTTPSIIGYGTGFQVQTPDASNISSVVLMRNGAVTHALNMDQRYVGLSFTVASGVLNVTGPPNGNIAPPGYYMLFILNKSGVPSIAQMVQVSNAADAPPSGTITSPASDVSISAGQSVSYTGTGTDPDGAISAYSWNFPGGSPSSGSVANPGSVVYSTPGTYVTTFTVTDEAGVADPSPPTRTITVSDFKLSASPASNTVAPGGSTTYSAVVTAGTGFTGSVSLTASGLPSGATVSFNPANITNSGSSTMTVSTTAVTSVGSYPLTITSKSGALTHTASVTLNVSITPPPPIGFVQVNSAVPISAASVQVTYTSAQGAGDLNIVAIGWSDTSTTVTSVTDLTGNPYAIAVGPTLQAGVQSQVIYYAKNIAPAAASGNTVTIHFSATASYPDVRILEYAGLDLANPLDVNAAATGNSAASDSGPATTTSANELIFAANYVQSGTTGAGVGLTRRIITSPDGDIAEDEIVSSAGTYHGTATLATSGGWIMQLVAFKGAAGTGGTPPTVPSDLTATAANSTQINLGWGASTSSGNTITGYRVERCTGTSCSNFSQIAAPTGTTYSDGGLTASTSYSYRVRAIDGNGLPSGYSNTASATTPGGPPPPPGITFVQSNSAVPASGGTVHVTFAAAQTAGDLNVVAIGWNDATTKVTSVTDSQGNGYAIAGVPTVQSGVQTVVIYYAKNIVAAAANANIVSISFSATAPYPDVRILEYAGADTTGPLDVAGGASGNSGTSDSGAFTTTSPNDLIFGANFVQTSTSSAGAGFTKRLITSPDGDIAEDEAVSVTGTYHATAALSSPGEWVMQLAAFKVANGTGGGTPPTVSLSAPAQNASLTGTVTVSATAAATTTGATIASVQFMVDNSNIGTPVTSSPYSISWNTGGVGNGTHTLTAQATDSNNNRTISASVTVSVTNAGTPATPAFVQGNYAVPATAQTSVSVSYLGAQSAGNLNVVVIGWSDSTSTIHSVADSKGNAYTIAGTPVIQSGVATQAIYYAKNIVPAPAGSNAITVTFSVAAAYPDIRILEYSGVDTTSPLDVVGGASGNSANASSGLVITANPTDLIIGADLVQTVTTGPGAGFISRMITNPDGDVVEDQDVISAGSYSAAALVSPAGQWIMQIVAFKAHP